MPTAITRLITAIAWTSSDATVATIATNGQVTSLATGTTNLTTTSTGDATKSDTSSVLSSSSLVGSWQLTPGISSIQPIHTPSSSLLTAV